MKDDTYFSYNEGETLHVARLELTASETVPADEETRAAYEEAGYAESGSYMQKIQAEHTALKPSQSLYTTYDRNSPATELYDVAKIKRNTIGKDN